MAVRNVDVNINVQDNLKQAQSKIKNLEKTLGQLKRLQNSLKGKIIDAKQINDKGRVKHLNTQFQKTKIQIEKVNMELNETRNKIKGLSKSTGGFFRENLNNFLSIMFFGMMLYNVFTKATKALFEGYKKAIPEASKFNVQTNKMSANWEYFKFQLADALANSSLFQKFTEFIIGILQWLQKLSPETKAWMATLIPIIAVFGGMLFLIGQIGLAIPGLSMLFGGLKKPIKTVKNKLKGINLKSVFKTGAILAVIAALYSAKKAMDVFYKSSEYGEKAAEDLSSVWQDTINSALQPLADAFDVNLKKVKSQDEAIIILGVTFHNIIIILGMLADSIIHISRLIVNMIQMSIQPAISAFKTLAKTIKSALAGDWGGVLDASMGHIPDIISGWKRDMDDISNSQDTFLDNIKNKSNSFKSYNDAIIEHRKELAKLEQQEKTTEFMKDLNSGELLNNNLSTRIPDVEKAVAGGIPSARSEVNQQTINLTIDGTSMFQTTGADYGAMTRVFDDDFLEESGLKTQLGDLN